MSGRRSFLRRSRGPFEPALSHEALGIYAFGLYRGGLVKCDVSIDIPLFEREGENLRPLRRRLAEAVTATTMWCMEGRPQLRLVWNPSSLVTQPDAIRLASGILFFSF